MEITTWAPQADSTSTAIEFVAETAPGDTMWFNVTGLRADAVYDVHVDTVRQSRSRDAGGISFSWSFSASHTFRLVAFVDTGSPVAIVNARQESSVGETVTFDGSGSHDDTGIIRHEWAFGDGTTAQGESVQYAYRFEGSYSVTLNVWDAVGNSGSASLTVRVSPAAPDNIPPFSVMDLRAAAIGENYVVLVWTAPGDDGDTGQASSYDVRYRTAGPTNSDNFDTSTPVPTPVPKPAGALEQLNVSGLASETIYWFAIRVADEVTNWSPVSNPVEVLTSEDPSDSGPERPPAVNGVWFTPSFSQLDVVFSKSMNRSSVGRSLIINPRVPFRVDWVNDAHVTLFLQAQLLEGTAYLLTVEPQAAVDKAVTEQDKLLADEGFTGSIVPNDNIFVKVLENVREHDVFVVQSLVANPSVSDAIMELLIMIDAFRRASAGRITAVMPFYAYGRSDKKDQPRVPITARLLADLIGVAGADRFLTMDMHQMQLQGFFSIPGDELSARNLLVSDLASILEREPEDTALVVPDLGYANPARKVAERLSLPLVFMQKTHRDNTGRSEIVGVIGEIAHKRAIIIDDEIDTGTTIVNTINVLRDHGVREIIVGCTHATLSLDAAERIGSLGIKELITTDTVPLRPSQRDRGKIRVLSVAPLFAEAIRRIHEGESVGQLFEPPGMQLPLRVP